MEEGSVKFQAKFIKILEQHPIIFSKSQLPDVKTMKSKAIHDIKIKIQTQFNINLTDQQLSKKIQNMKARLKSKIDVKRIGNQPIVLKDWERKLLDIMQGRTNLAIGRLKGKPFTASSRTSTSKDGCDVNDGDSGSLPAEIPELVDDDDDPPTETPEQEPSTSAAPTRAKRKLEETEETRDLSTNELQRLVLLKQLRVLQLQEGILLMKKERMEKERERREEKNESECEGSDLP
ncbi:hypothetical protein ANN_25699 [Periplaneta americana]|uniref:Uncharacterized protein n=1 Tax=Periplaneta americana TaxID=6978 RepID=A0ABQ8S4A2_PERAM|nr:hypothetical protein ANN_25699 [Periplaneta americana]